MTSGRQPGERCSNCKHYDPWKGGAHVSLVDGMCPINGRVKGETWCYHYWAGQ